MFMFIIVFVFVFPFLFVFVFVWFYFWCVVCGVCVTSWTKGLMWQPELSFQVFLVHFYIFFNICICVYVYVYNCVCVTSCTKAMMLQPELPFQLIRRHQLLLLPHQHILLQTHPLNKVCQY